MSRRAWKQRTIPRLEDHFQILATMTVSLVLVDFAHPVTDNSHKWFSEFHLLLFLLHSAILECDLASCPSAHHTLTMRQN